MGGFYRNLAELGEWMGVVENDGENFLHECGVEGEGSG